MKYRRIGGAMVFSPMDGLASPHAQPSPREQARNTGMLIRCSGAKSARRVPDL